MREILTASATLPVPGQPVPEWLRLDESRAAALVAILDEIDGRVVRREALVRG